MLQGLDMNWKATNPSLPKLRVCVLYSVPASDLEVYFSSALACFQPRLHDGYLLYQVGPYLGITERTINSSRAVGLVCDLTLEWPKVSWVTLRGRQVQKPCLEHGDVDSYRRTDAPESRLRALFIYLDGNLISSRIVVSLLNTNNSLSWCKKLRCVLPNLHFQMNLRICGFNVKTHLAAKSNSIWCNTTFRINTLIRMKICKVFYRNINMCG